MSATNDTQLYADSNGRLVEVTGGLTDPVQFCPQGGGFVRKMPKDKFLETFKPAVMPGFKKARFTGDWLPEGCALEGYTDGQRWNGWAMPRLPLDQAKRLLEHSSDLRYDEQRDAFIQKPQEGFEEDGEDVFEAETLTVNGEQVKAYAVGAGSWCWDMASPTEATPAQLEQMEATLANDESSSDEEMLAFFVNECRIPEEVARKAISHRVTFLATAIPQKGLLAKLMAKSDN